jgi:hypothetical protein
MVFAQIATVDEVITKLAVGSQTPTPTGVPA